MKIITLLMLAYLAMPMSLIAKQVSIDEAKTVAKNFYYNNAKTSSYKNYEDIDMRINHIEAEENPYFYVFENESSNGFVIISAQDFVKPILGFSDQSEIDFDNLSPELNSLLEAYVEQIKYGIKNNFISNLEIKQKWQNLQLPKVNRTSVVEPLGPLLITNWNQSPYYNDMCPSNSSGEHAVAGCVAVAMAQVMKYYNYPSQGSGSKSYNDYSGLTNYANINFSQEEYKWNNMPISLSGENDYLAKLMYHCGHSVSMNWEVDGSGTQSSYIVTAARVYFGYSSTTTEYSQYSWSGNQNYDDDAWGLKLRNELDELRPVIYSSGVSAGGAGHCWNCDGYMSDDEDGYIYHMNFGWGGSGNGYFPLDQLLAQSIPDGPDHYFDYHHQMILGMYPASEYPYSCNGDRHIDGFEGVIDDGSMNQNYENDIDCMTIVQPECATGQTSIIFQNFDLADGDSLFLYNGTSIEDPLMAVFDQSNIPIGTYKSNNNGMLIRFKTDGEANAHGWDARYISSACGTFTTTEPQGILEDGSGSCDYEKNLNCYFYIEPINVDAIMLQVSEFNLDGPDKDYLKIYDGETDELLATWKGSDTPPSNFLVNSGKVKLKFRTYGDENIGAGWKMAYITGPTVGVDELIDFEDLVKVYPNPFNGDASVEIYNPDAKKISLSILDITGRNIATRDFGTLKNSNTIKLSDLGDINFGKGVYLLNIKIGNQTKTYKLISE